jgi:glycerol-1-phosphate dehydrogenase [NAD(P)+]
MLPYDPADGEAFWKAIKRIKGYPKNKPGRLIGHMLFEPDALFKLPQLLGLLGVSPTQPLLVVMDTTPMQRGRERLKPLVLGVLEKAGWLPIPLVLEPGIGEHVRTDMEQIGLVEGKLKEKTVVISLGSGTVTDIVKQASYTFEKKTGHRTTYVAYPTANSMGAYTSNVATAYVRGVKRSLPSRLPDALVYDLKTLRDAPYTMTVAGVGDMLACFVSFPDWLIAHHLGLDPGYSEFQQVLMGPIEKVFVDYAAQIRDGTLEGLALQARFMAAAGVGVSLLNASTPLSGYEHIISHLIDQQAEFSNRPPASHGTQVVLATLLVSIAYRYFLDNFKPSEVDLEHCYPSADTMKKRIDSAFSAMGPSGEAAAECWDEYRIKLDAWQANRWAFERFLRDWPEIRSMIEQYLRPPGWIARVLANLGSPLSFDELEPPVAEDLVRFAFLNAPLIRRRVTLGDLLIFLDWDRAALWDHVWYKSKVVVEAARCQQDQRGS